MLRTTLLLFLFGTFARGQIITTIAGTDSVFPLGGVPAAVAPLKNPAGVAVDVSGNIYIADKFNHLVARVSPNGNLTVIAGNGRSGFSGDGGPATGASLSYPKGVALDAAGNLYIADSGNYCIRKVSAGIITTVAGGGGSLGDGGPATSAALNQPSGVALDSAGNLYIADWLNSRIRKVSGGTISTVAGNGTAGFSGDGGPATSAALDYPEGLALDSAGNLYIADTGNSRIREVSGGTITTVAGKGTSGFSGDGGPATNAALASPFAVALDAAGNLYIADSGSTRIRRVSGGTITTVAGNGTQGFSGDGGPATSGALNQPSGLVLDTAGNLYIADYGNGRVRRISAGTITTVAGNGTGFFAGDGGPAVNAALGLPDGVAWDAAGNLYIADTANNRVRKVSGGTITTVAGNGMPAFSGDNGPATSAALHGPFGVGVDAAGNLYIADGLNNRIRKVSNGVITTVAGNGAVGPSGDGGPATSAALSFPTGVALDAAGNLYIADQFDHRIRKVSGGTITTVAGNGTPAFSGDSGPATGASLNYPSAVALDAAGNLYIADGNNHRIRKVSGGTITTVAGNGTGGFSGDGGPATSAELNSPKGVTLDAAGNLYIADYGNSRIRTVSGGTITTVAGNGAYGFSGDGGLATGAALSTPFCTAVDPNGNLYIADQINSRIREVLAVKPSYQAAPATLSFSATSGGSATSGQVISLTSGVPGLTFTAAPSTSWLTVTPSAGTIPSTVQVIANPSALAAGSYQGAVTVTVRNSSAAAVAIPVTFTVQPSATAALGVDTQNVSFSANQGGGAVSQTLQVLNSGGGSLVFATSAATSSGGSWLGISPTNGTATPSSPASLTVSATPGSLAAGTYSGTVTITGAGKSIAIPVTLSVSAPAATILLSQSALSFNVVAQGGLPLPKNFGILNTGKGSMGWTATATTLSGGNWLRISPSNGTVNQPYLDVSLVNVSIDPSSLAAGTYYGRIQVSAVAVNTPQALTVILNVLPVGTTLGPQVFPAGLIFTGAAGVTPGSQDVQVGNPAGTATSFVSGIIGTGLDYLPKDAGLQANQPTTIHVYPDFSRVGPGSIQHGFITLGFLPDGSSQTISVLTVVAPSSAVSNSLTGHAKGLQPEASGCGSQALLVVFREPQPNQSTLSAIAGQATTIEVQVSDGCGNLVGPGGQNASVKASFSNQDSVPMVHIGTGVWQGSWRPLSSGTVLTQVTAFAPGPGTSLLSGQSATLTAVVTAAAAAAPTVTAQGVVHAASDVGGVPIAPGGLITIYGQNLADTAGLSRGLPLPQQLNGTQVLLGNQPLPILYTNPGQLNVQVPYGVPVNTQYQLTVQRGNSYSVPQQLVVAQAEPGIFTLNQQGSGQGSIVKSDGVTLAQSGTPASIGETVVIYCTGLGSVTPRVTEGMPAPGSPLSTTDNAVTVTIGGKAAAVTFAGLTPGDPGLYQINAVVPAGIQTGDAVPVVISVAGQTSPISPAVTLAVK